MNGAIELHEQSLTIYRTTGNTLGEAANLDNVGTGYLKLGQPERAIDFTARQPLFTNRSRTLPDREKLFSISVWRTRPPAD